MSKLFYGCDSLNYVYLPNIDMINCYSYDNIFSNINSIKYIDLKNFQNDKILSNIFNGAINKFYVCQEEPIISNPNAYNCCTYNFTTNECNLIKNSNEPNSSTSSTDTDNIENPNSNTYSYSSPGGKSKKSSGISIGIIIGIIAGIVVIISIIILIICCIRRRKKLSEIPKETENNNSTTVAAFDSSVQINQSTIKDVYEYEPEIKSINPKIKIKLETTSQSKINILIDPEKTMTELIQFYFQILNQPELFGDSTIRFLISANFISHDSKGLIKNYINKKNDVNIIVVDDLDDKIKRF